MKKHISAIILMAVVSLLAGASLRADKLSTFIVQVYAHDVNMQNALVRQEMVVSLPVKLSVVEPKYLYKGDRYVLHGTVSNSSDSPVDGIAALQVYPSSDWQGSAPLETLSQSLIVPAGGSVPFEFEVDPKDARRAPGSRQGAILSSTAASEAR